MSDSEDKVGNDSKGSDSQGNAPRLRERTIFLLACGGILLLLGLMLGVLMSKDKQRPGALDDVQVGEMPGTENAIFVEGMAPMAVSAGTEFVVRAKVINIGEDPIRDLQLVIGAYRLIVSVPEGQNPTKQIEILPPGQSTEFEATLKAIEIGRTSIMAHAIQSNGKVAAARYFEIGITKEKVAEPSYDRGSAMALRVTTFGPATVDAARPYEVMFVVENTGQMPLDGVLLQIRPDAGVRSIHKESLDYEIQRLEPGGQRAVRARFRLDGVARGQVRVMAGAAGEVDSPPWAAVEGIHTVVVGSE